MEGIENIETQKIEVCILCNTQGEVLYYNLKDYLFNIPGTWNIMSCPNCGLCWINPRPVSHDIEKIYKNYLTHTLDINKNLLHPLYRMYLVVFYNPLLAISGLKEETKKIESMMLNKEKTKGKLLDIGCGNGKYLYKMQKIGWGVVGIEPDSYAVKLAREYFGLNVFKGSLEDFRFPDNHFDAITMHHVIEHLPVPDKTLLEIYRILKNNGKLVIVTPNIASLGHRIFQKAWRGIEVPRHFCLFSPKTLSLIVSQAGFKKIELFTTSRLAKGIWEESCFIRLKETKFYKSFKKQSLWLKIKNEIIATLFQITEHELTMLKNIGEEIILIARK